MYLYTFTGGPNISEDESIHQIKFGLQQYRRRMGDYPISGSREVLATQPNEFKKAVYGAEVLPVRLLGQKRYEGQLVGPFVPEDIEQVATNPVTGNKYFTTFHSHLILYYRAVADYKSKDMRWGPGGRFDTFHNLQFLKDTGYMPKGLSQKEQEHFPDIETVLEKQNQSTGSIWAADVLMIAPGPDGQFSTKDDIIILESYN